MATLVLMSYDIVLVFVDGRKSVVGHDVWLDCFNISDWRSLLSVLQKHSKDYCKLEIVPCYNEPFTKLSSSSDYHQ